MADQLNLDESQVVKTIIAYRRESDEAKRDRMNLNEQNYDMYHLKHNFSHKKKGQSREVLSKVAMATEQISSFFVQALVDIGDWWNVEWKDGSEHPTALLAPHEIKKLTQAQLDKNDYYRHVGLQIKQALLGALAITKTGDTHEIKPRYVVKKLGKGKKFRRKLERIEDKTWKLNLSILRQKNYYPDPTGQDLYEIEDFYMDLHELKRWASEDETLNAEAVNQLAPFDPQSSEEEYWKTRETGQNTTAEHARPQAKVTEFWGTLVDSSTGDILAENVNVLIANDRHVIRKPTKNFYWHQCSPYIRRGLLEVPNAVWPKALMDAGTQHNKTMNELFNLMIDAALKSVHGINQIRVNTLVDQAQVADGVPAGTSLLVNDNLPIGGKAIETVVTGDIPPEASTMFNIISQEGNASMLTNDLRQGVTPFRQVKATEVIEASNTITSIFQGIAKSIELGLIEKELERAWMLIAQNLDQISKDELITLFGNERGEEISQLPPEEVFAETVQGIRFQVYGISRRLAKTQDYQKYTTLLQTVASSDMLLEGFLQKYDLNKLLTEIINTLDIDTQKIKNNDPPINQGASPMEQPGAMGGAQTPNEAGMTAPTPAGLADLFGGNGSFPSPGDISG